jgi:hypothetical protein
MSQTGPKPTLADAIRRAVECAVADLHVAIPARVERVDLAKALVDVKPLVKDRYSEDGATKVQSVPVVTNVPLVFPGAGGMRITFPVTKGDTVLLVFSERSLDSWLVRGGEVDPLDDRRHSLSDAVAIPGLNDFAHPWKAISSSAVTIGKDGEAQHPAGLGDKIRTELDAIWSAIYGGHVHAGVETGGGSTAPASGSPSKQVVESETVKITS